MTSNLKRPSGEPHANPRPKSRHTSEDKVAEEAVSDFVCEACNRVDWPYLANMGATRPLRERHRTNSRVISPFNATTAELSTSTCWVCRLLSVIKPSTYDGHECMVFADVGPWVYTRLRVTLRDDVVDSKPRDSSMVRRKEHYPCLTIIGSHDDHDLISTEIQPDSIDSRCYDDLKSFMRDCIQNHGPTCRPISKSSRVPGLKLIEISSGKVVDAADQCEYLALSYVWGECQYSDDPKKAPRVIQDTFSVAEKLGLDYVWIDKYASPCATLDTVNCRKLISNLVCS